MHQDDSKKVIQHHMNTYLLLTGATGLLGRYLLRDLLTADVPVAVLVRRNRRQSARERIEALLRTWENQLERELPRPVVVEGDVCKGNLGLQQSASAWLAENCDSVLHSAASLKFQGTDRQNGEPWQTNVFGLQNVLDFCKRSEIRDFHHVSTAYVCGLRQGRFLEAELEVGQNVGNEYEKSKIEAERMLHSADFLSPPTIYRPAIIVGDSQTGFTTTFHGFYALLRLAYTLVQSQQTLEYGRTDNPDRSPTRLTLDGDESKNLVPVDWVSAFITHVVHNRQHHGQTYHLTPSKPVTVRLLQEVLEETLNFYNSVFCGSGVTIEHPNFVEKLFYDHFNTYHSYWRDDPVFDCTNTLEAAPHLPCPDVDKPMLLHLAQKAIEMDFRWSDPAVVEDPAVADLSKTQT